MLILKRFLVLVTIGFTAVGSLSAASYNVVLQSGHEDLPVAMRWHPDSSTVVSVGEDGRLIVTDPDRNQVLHRFRVSDSQVHNLALNPESDRAALVSRNSDGFTVSVWDWGDEELEFEYELDTEPLFLSWSARGRYLIVGNLGEPTIVVLEGRTGRRLSYLQRLPSLFNYGYIGSTETILMTYSSSGALRYWDIRSSALKLSAETITSLEDPTVLQVGNKVSLFAHRNETLYLINRQTGAVQDRMEIPGLIDVSVDPETGEVDALSFSLAGTQLHKLDAGTERFLPRNPLLEDEDDSPDDEVSYRPVTINPLLKPVKVLRRERTTYLMDEDGRLISDKSGTFRAVIDDRVWRPDSMVFSGSSIFLSRQGTLQRFTAPFFSAESRGNTGELEGLSREELKLDSRAEETGLLALEDGKLLLWDRSGTGSANGYRILDIGSQDVEFHPLNGQTETFEIVDDQRFLSVDRSGNITMWDGRDGSQISSYAALGILDAAYDAEGDYVLTGRSSTGRAGTPLELVDMRTGESVPVDDSRFMVYSVVSAADGIYTIGIDRSGSTPKTVVMRHLPGDPSRSRVIYRMDGEDLNGQILVHPDGDAVFVNLGGVITLIDGSRRTRFQWDEPIVSLGFRGSVLYGIDIDGSLVMWDSRGNVMLQVYFFEDGQWLAMPENREKIWASPGAIENVVIYRDGRVMNPRQVRYSRIDSSRSGS